MAGSFLCLEPRDWPSALRLGASLRGWIFRGHARRDTPLETTLLRARRESPGPFQAEWEERLLRRFQSRAHHYVSDLPKRGDRLEWLALIQHYGGPTRLLDFSHSFYLAAFFAVEKARADEAAAVWAVNYDMLSERIAREFDLPWPPRNRDRMNRELNKLANAFLAGEREPEPFVINVAPERMNERLSIQQGLFLVPCDLGVPFEENLAAVFGLPPDFLRRGHLIEWGGDALPPDAAIVRIELSAGLHTDALRDLHAMNVTSASLFPGLDGFARSLYYDLHVMDDAGDRDAADFDGR